MAEVPSKLGFPAPLLGEDALRLQVYAAGDGWIAWEKPAGVSVDASPGAGAGGRNLTAAIRRQLEQGKPEMLRLRAECVRSVFPLDEEVAGCALLALTAEATESLRNIFGSRLLRFTFGMVCGGSELAAGTRLRCEVPVAQNGTTGAVFLSAKWGKRTATDFVCEAKTEQYTLWTATADYLRPGQIRLHAAEVGIPIVGDTNNGGGEVPTAGDVRQRRYWKGESRAYYPAPLIWLQEVQAMAENEQGLTQIALPPPRGIDVFLRKSSLRVDQE